jgi:hypothetical protein
MYNPARTTRVFTGKVRPHRYLYRIPKPGGYYEYVYLDDLDKEEDEGQDNTMAMLQAFFIKVCKKIYGVKGETMATRFANGRSISITERHKIDKVVAVILNLIPSKYKKAFREFINHCEELAQA